MKPVELHEGFVFDADESLKKLYPEIEKWVLVRMLPRNLHIQGGVITNDSGYYWMASPTQCNDVEVLVCALNICKVFEK